MRADNRPVLFIGGHLHGRSMRILPMMPNQHVYYVPVPIEVKATMDPEANPVMSELKVAEYEVETIVKDGMIDHFVLRWRGTR